MVDKTIIGTSWPDREISVEKGALRLFAKATGETDPIYSDEDAAKEAGMPGLPVPPTFLFSLENMAPAESFWLEDLKIELAKVLHAEQSFEYDRMIFAGERLRFRTSISDAYNKKDGLLEFVVRDCEVFDSEGKRCAKMQTTLVVRHG